MSTLVCQSCGMPLTEEALIGTDAEHNKVKDYCKYCYESGAFTQPDLTLEEMVETCVPIMVQEGMEEQAARSMMQNYLPNLKRWSSPDGDSGRPAVQPDRYADKAEIRLMGIAATTTNASELSGGGIISKLWARFGQEAIRDKLPARADAQQDQNLFYACYTNYENGALGEYTFLIGAEADASDEVPAGMQAVVVPPATYAVFTTAKGPMDRVVLEAWQAIWKWSALAADMERTFTGDFELYDERSLNPQDAQVDIYIAVRPKGVNQD
ncbi:zinc ribbon domain-containing protein [Paenibacillus hodogayensis]|uniref:Zinc ribbon domain-containing protein n=1 Tax=Paenibacillus hodogayensis TaxID=279208 RepID=A0ABV5W1I6_9BACL